MASRTIETTDDMENAFAFLAEESKQPVDKFFIDKLSVLFGSLVSESNKKKHDLAKAIMASGDPSKIIPELKKLLG